MPRARQHNAQAGDSSEDESVIDHDFSLGTPPRGSFSPTLGAPALGRPGPGPLLEAGRSGDSLRDRMQKEAGQRKSQAAGATQQLVQELSWGSQSMHEESRTGLQRSSQRRALAEATAALKESSASAFARRRPFATIPSSSSAYEPLGEPEPTRVWHTPDAPGLWIRHDAPMSEPRTVSSECAGSFDAHPCDATGGHSEALRHAGSMEMDNTVDASSRHCNEAFKGISLIASWLEDTPAHIGSSPERTLQHSPVPPEGPVERAMQSLMMDKASVISGHTRVDSPDKVVPGQTRVDSPDKQGHCFASLRNSARANLLGAFAPDVAGRCNTRLEPVSASVRQRCLEPQIAHCPSLPPVPQLGSARSVSEERESRTSTIHSTACRRELLDVRDVVARAASTAPRSPSPQGLVSPSGASLPPRAALHEEGSMSICQDPVVASRWPQKLPSSPSPVRLRPLPSALTPEPRRCCIRSIEGQSGHGSCDERDGADSSMLRDFAQLFDSPVAISATTSLGLVDTPAAPGSRMKLAIKHPEKTVGEVACEIPASLLGDELPPVIARGSPAAAGCSSGIAQAHQQVGRMRKQLQELAASCDTLEGMAAPLQAPQWQASLEKADSKSSFSNEQSAARRLVRGAVITSTSDLPGSGQESRGRNCLEELASAHEVAMRAAAGQLTALQYSSMEDSPSIAPEAAALKRLRDWVGDMVAECHGRGPPCWAIAGMLEAAVEAIAQGATAPKMQLCSVVEAQMPLMYHQTNGTRWPGRHSSQSLIPAP